MVSVCSVQIDSDIIIFDGVVSDFEITEAMLKYLYKNSPTAFPCNFSKYPIMKNLMPLPSNVARTKTAKLMEKNPAESVNTLKGIGVNAATKIAVNAFASKSCIYERKKR